MPSPAEIRERRRKPAKPRKHSTRKTSTVPELRPSLGGQVVDWIETYCVHGPGDIRGAEVTLTDEEKRLLWRAYEVWPLGHPRAGRRVYGRVAYVRRKGVRKTELSAWVTCCELLGPVRLAGWDADGNPVGRPVTSPYIPVAATSLEQLEDTLWGAVYAITSESPISDDYDLDITQLGIVELATGGEMKPVTASSIARDGGRPSFSPKDETHLWYRPELLRLADTLDRNLAKRPLADPWTLTTTTAWAPKQGSVAELDHRLHLAELAGDAPEGTILWDMRRASDDHDLDSDDGLRAAIIEASGDAMPWTDVDLIAADYRRGSPADGKRYWLSIPASVSEDETWLKAHPGAYEECREPGLKTLAPDGGPVAVGVDAALRSDSVSVRALQARPDGTIASVSRTWIAEDGRTYDRAALRNYLRSLAGTYSVQIGYDPRYLESDAQDLEDEGLVMIEVPQSPERMVPACRLAYELVVDRKLRHDDDEVTAGQVVAAVPREADGGWRLSKGRSGRRIDASIALAIAAYVLENWADEIEPTVW